jgi:hypothetical protein
MIAIRARGARAYVHMTVIIRLIYLRDRLPLAEQQTGKEDRHPREFHGLPR